MTFLQPWMLLALPILALPIIIHLVHLRRHQTVPWAAMRFLLEATKMASGFSKLKQYIILALRTLAVATLVLFASRPLISGISGWLGVEDSQLSIIVVDRSPSMQIKLDGAGDTKQQLAMRRIQNWLSSSGNPRIVCIATGLDAPITDLEVNDLLNDPRLEPTAMSTNIPSLLESAREYIERNNVPKCTIWIASDLNEGDWRTADASWSAIRDGFSKSAADVSFQIVELADQTDNRAVRVTGAELLDSGVDSELSLSLVVVSHPNQTALEKETISVELELEGNRTAIPLNLERGYGELSRYVVKLSAATQTGTAEQIDQDGDQTDNIGWGSVRIPADSNEADNISYFTFETKPVRRTLVVSDNPTTVEAISIAASIAPNPFSKSRADESTVSQLDTVDWDRYAVVVWHEQLPNGSTLEKLTRFVDSGGQLLLLPPGIPNDNSAFGIQWGEWSDLVSGSTLSSNDETPTLSGRAISPGATVDQWRNDSVLLGNTLSGTSLPLSELRVARACRVSGNLTELASLEGQIPLLVRSDAVSEKAKGAVYALSTTTSTSDSSLGRDGIAIYVMLQRLLDAGMQKVGNAKSVSASMDQLSWLKDSQPLSISGESLSNQQWEQQGVFLKDKLLIAQNRPAVEDEIKQVTNDTLKSIFGELKWYRINAVEVTDSLVQEIWRWFALAMLVALLVEGILTAPSRPTRVVPTSGKFST